MNPVEVVTRPAGLEYSQEQIDLIKRTVCNGASNDQLALFLHQCRRTNLDPLTRQIYGVMRDSWDASQGRKVPTLTIQTSIDGFRLIAERSGKYAGQLGPMWCGEDGVWCDVWVRSEPPVAAKVGALRNDFKEPLWAVARWESYAQSHYDKKTGGQKLSSFWAKMPDLMLAKCFDEKTEVLTDRGFELISEAQGTILQVTPDGLQTTGAIPFSQEYDGDMVTLDSDDLNFCVTPNHEMLTTSGKIDAGEMFSLSRARPKFWIPRIISGSRNDATVSDEAIQLAAVFLADGTPYNGKNAKVSVSRPYKIDFLFDLAAHSIVRDIETAGDTAVGKNGRAIVTRTNKKEFIYHMAKLGGICTLEKQINTETILRFSKRQARLFVETLIEFDGADNGAGTLRFYTSNEHIRGVFELASVIAGFSVGSPHERTSDISDKINYQLTVSERDAIPIIRWGREYNGSHGANHANRTGLALTKNESGKVWCVTVPSGVIVVRRNGFSMLCGNCAEGLALRKAFPQELGGLFSAEEMAQADRIEPPTDADHKDPEVRTEPPAKAPMGEAERIAHARLAQTVVRDMEKIGWKITELNAYTNATYNKGPRELTFAQLTQVHKHIFELSNAKS